MLKRKILTLFISTICSIFLMATVYAFMDGEGVLAIFPMALFISWIALPVILLYGFPISLLSEKLTNSITSNYRILWTLLIHLVFGISFVFIVGVLFETQIILTDFSAFWNSYEVIFIASIGVSLCFWFIDEGLKCCKFSQKIKPTA